MDKSFGPYRNCMVRSLCHCGVIGEATELGIGHTECSEGRDGDGDGDNNGVGPIVRSRSD